jgi:hypothetical protein
MSVGVEVRGRPVKIALLRTIEYRALGHQARVDLRLAEREVLVGEMGEEPSTRRWPAADSRGRPLAAKTNPGEDVVRLLAEASRKGLSERDTQLLGALSVGGSTCEQLSAVEGITVCGIRRRRAAAIRRLADSAA